MVQERCRERQGDEEATRKRRFCSLSMEKRGNELEHIGGVSWKSEREGVIVSETGWWFQSPPDPRRARFWSGCSSRLRCENRRLTRSFKFKEWAAPCAYRHRLLADKNFVPAGLNSGTRDVVDKLTELVCCFIDGPAAREVRKKSGVTIGPVARVFKTVSSKSSFLVINVSSFQRRLFILLVTSILSDTVWNVKFD